MKTISSHLNQKKKSTVEKKPFLDHTSVCRAIGPLHDPVTWFKITYGGDFQNKGRCIVLEVSLCNLLTSGCDIVPCDRTVQKAYSVNLIIHIFCFLHHKKFR